MQLVAYGAQDVYLTGNPQITLFKVVYRRHTNFSMEPIEIPVDAARPGQKVSILMLRNGDLATRTYFKSLSPELTPSNNSSYTGEVAWVNRLGHAMMQYAQVFIGGAPIDKHYGVWLDVWYELTHTTEQEKGYNAMIGNVPELTTLAPSIAGGYDIYVPFQFWFNRNYGLALPLIALQYHEVRIEILFERWENLVVYTVDDKGNTPTFNNLQYNNSSLLIDYIYLDSEERRRFAQIGHEYLIEQLQEQGANMSPAQPNANAQQSIILNFNHPCKEMIWTQRIGAWNGTLTDNRFLTYTNLETPEAWNNALQVGAQHLVKGMLNLDFREDTDEEISGFNSAANIVTVTRVEMAADQAMAVVNGDNKSNTLYRFTVVGGDPGSSNPTVFGIINYPLVTRNAATGEPFNLADTLHSVSVDLQRTENDDGGYSLSILNINVTEHNLTLEDVSSPLNIYIDQRYSNGTQTAKTAGDVHVVQFSNYGIRIDGKGNMVIKGKIVFNGHDRFTEREGNYFNYVQPNQHHTHTPADGINLYSFSLHPEQHQPSGTANLSRIDSTRLEYTTGDTLKAYRNTPLDIYNGTLIYVFVVNYNILRILSGMGGLAYSN